MPGGRILAQRIKNGAKKLAAYLTYSVILAALPVVREGRKAEKTSHRIAVVCLAALGDFVTFCAGAAALVAGGSRLTLICREGVGIEDFAAQTGLFERVVSLPHRFSSRMDNLRRLRRVKADLVLVAPVERHILSDLYVLAVAAPVRVLPDTQQGCSLPGLKRRVDRRVRTVPVTALNEQERYMQYLSAAGLYSGPLGFYRFPNARTQRPLARPCLAIFPGAGGGTFKCWPVERFAWVADQLRRKTGCDVLVLGTGAEQALCNQMCKQLGTGVQNLCGKTPLEELTKVLSRCTLVLSNDSGGAHVAMACGVLTVVVCGGWEYGRFYPNPYLPEDCRSVLEPKNALACIPCEQSRPDCCADTCAPCVAAVEQTAVLAAVLELFEG